MPRATDRLPPPHGADLATARARHGGGGDWVDFSNSVNPWGIPDATLRDLVGRSVGGLREYPDPAYRALRGALAAHEGIDPACLWPVNGSAAGLYDLARLHAGRPAVAPAPSFREYAASARAHGSLCEEPVLWRSARAGEAWLDAVPEEGILFAGTPNSPTGEILERELLEEIVARARSLGSTVVLDEAFLPFVPGGGERSFLREASSEEGLVVLRTLTKTHALPGLRLGWAVAAPETIERLRSAVPPWAVGPLGLAVAEALGDLAPEIERQLSDLARESVRWGGLLRSLGLAVSPSSCHFFLCEIPETGPTADELKEVLARRRLLIRSCADYPGLGPRHIRITTRRPEENDRLLAALEEVL